MDGLSEWLAERFRRHDGNADVVRQELAMEKGIAVSLRTVESRRARLFGKLGVRTRAELFRYAAEIGVLNRGIGSPHRA